MTTELEFLTSPEGKPIETSAKQPVSIAAQSLTLGYDNKRVCEQLSLTIPPRQFTVIIGPNGCGKSTLLKSLCRLLKPLEGTILLDGKDIHRWPTKEVAKKIGLLPQSANSPNGIRVYDLVARGRYPHQSVFRQWSDEDKQAVEQAMVDANVTELAQQTVDSLSGGQRQRVWIAMVLAQQTPTLMLDEPTTYLDIAHQIELLDLFKTLNIEQGRTVVAVLHDLNQACRYADHVIALAEGELIAQGAPQTIIDSALVERVFGLKSEVVPDPVTGTPMIVPLSRWAAKT